MISDDRLLTLQEVAADLGIQPATVRELVKSGQLPAIQINASMVKRRLRFRRADVQKWLNERVVSQR